MTVGRIPSVEGGIQPTLLTTKGDIIVATGNATLVRQGVGSDGQVLTADSAEADGVKWATPTSGMTNPMTTTGDTIFSSSGSTPARRAIGTTGQVLTVSGGVPVWATPAGGGGKVLQVVTANTTTVVNNSTTTYADTNLTATITPSASTSRILVLISQSSSVVSTGTIGDAQMQLQLLRGATSLGTTFMYIGAARNGYSEVRTEGDLSFTFLDSPATTSATTYKTQHRQNTASTTAIAQPGSTTSSIVLLEIGA